MTISNTPTCYFQKTINPIHRLTSSAMRATDIEREQLVFRPSAAAWHHNATARTYYSESDSRKIMTHATFYSQITYATVVDYHRSDVTNKIGVTVFKTFDTIPTTNSDENDGSRCNLTTEYKAKIEVLAQKNFAIKEIPQTLQ